MADQPGDLLYRVAPTRNSSEEDSPPFSIYNALGACRKTPVAAENHHLEAKKAAGGEAAKCGICCRPMGFARTPSHLSNRLFAMLSRTNPSRGQTFLPATTTRDLISISEMMT